MLENCLLVYSPYGGHTMQEWHVNPQEYLQELWGASQNRAVAPYERRSRTERMHSGTPPPAGMAAQICGCPRGSTDQRGRREAEYPASVISANRDRRGDRAGERQATEAGDR